MDGTARAAAVERVEMMAEHDGRTGKPPNPEDAILEVMSRWPMGDHSLDLLHLRYWMFYAAGVADPDEAADVTLRFWREMREA